MNLHSKQTKQTSKFKELTTKEKIEYIWDYYHLHILGALFGALLLTMFIYSWVTEKEATLSVVMINTPEGSSADEYDNVEGFDAFLEEYGYEVYDGAIEMISGYTLSDGEKTNAEIKRSLEAYLGAGIPHVLFGTGEVYMDYVDMGVFADLSELLPEELLKKYEDQLIYSDNNGEEAPYPCAIYLENNAWVMGNGYYEDCYFGILAQAPSMEVATDFAEYILR